MKSHLLSYVLTFLALLGLTAATYFLSKVELGKLALPVAIAIASTKGLLVALFFMHLKEHPSASRLAVAVAVFFVLLLMGLAVADLATRFPPALPRDWSVSPPAVR